MGNITEIEALKAIDDALTKVDEGARERVLAWALNKFARRTLSVTPEVPAVPASGLTKAKSKGKGKVKSKIVLSMVKELNLKPPGKKSLTDFVAQKKPASDTEKCTIVVYYFQHEATAGPVSVNHVYTAFKHLGWRVPADLPNTLQYTASHFAWLDTANGENIRVTAMGENLVEHDLPRNPKK